MAAGDIKQAAEAKWTAIDANDLGDAGTSTSAARDNTSNLDLEIWGTIEVDDGAGAAAAGIPLFLLVSVDGGTIYSDADAHPLLTPPSPNGGTETMHFNAKIPPGHYKLAAKNSSGAACDIKVEVLETFGNVAQS